MKKITGSLIVVFFMASLIGLSAFHLFNPVECQAGGLSPVVTVGTPQVKLSKKAEVIIMGTGFKPGQEINLVFITADGLKADIAYALKPLPKPDKTGAWMTTWSAGRYVSKKLVSKGAFRIIVFDAEYTELAHTAISFTK